MIGGNVLRKKTNNYVGELEIERIIKENWCKISFKK